MAGFRDWSESDYDGFHQAAFDNIFNEIPSVPDLDDERLQAAEELFEQGWLTFGEYSPEELQSIRDAFYDMVFISEDMFDWNEYRELYSDT